MPVRMIHEKHGAMHVYSPMEEAAAAKNGWVREVVEAPTPPALVETVAEEVVDEKTKLVAEAEALGINVDKRWSVKTLANEIHKKR